MITAVTVAAYSPVTLKYKKKGNKGESEWKWGRKKEEGSARKDGRKEGSKNEKKERGWHQWTGERILCYSNICALVCTKKQLYYS